MGVGHAVLAALGDRGECRGDEGVCGVFGLGKHPRLWHQLRAVACQSEYTFSLCPYAAYNGRLRHWPPQHTAWGAPQCVGCRVVGEHGATPRPCVFPRNRARASSRCCMTPTLRSATCCKEFPRQPHPSLHIVSPRRHDPKLLHSVSDLNSIRKLQCEAGVLGARWA
jgi:hypothetical protein